MNANTYYVATTGNDATGTGAIGTPWKTPQYGCKQLTAGDTLYIRGGTYKTNDGVGWYTNSALVYVDTESSTWDNGTAENPIVVMSYPSEKAVLDGSELTDATYSHRGIRLVNAEYWYLIDLDVTNMLHDSIAASKGLYCPSAISLYACQNCQIIRCRAYANQGRGIDVGMHVPWVGYKYSTGNVIKYCDAWDNYDRYSHNLVGGVYKCQPGTNGDGFGITYHAPGTINRWWGCRSWYNGDDGYDCIVNNGRVYVDSCWAWRNGRGTYGNGEGFKLGNLYFAPAADSTYRWVTNCVACYNKVDGEGAKTDGDGFTGNGIEGKVIVYNNTSFRNSGKGFNWDGCRNVASVFRNNFADQNSGGSEVAVFDAHLYSNFVQDHNSWNIEPNYEYISDTVYLYRTDAASATTQFLTLDTTGISGARGANGELPQISFLKLAASSIYINAGVDVGLDYVGAAPDIGYDEYYFGGQDYDHWYIAPTGNDLSGDGSEGTPWKTLAKACSEVTEEGDIIHVAAGAYTETVQSVLSPGVSIIGAGATSIINSTITTTDTPILLLSSVAEGTDGNQSISNLKFDGGDTANMAIKVLRRNNVHIHDCTFEDFFSRGVTFHGTALDGNGCPTIFQTGCKFYDNIVHDCSDYYGSDKDGDGRGALNIGGTKDMEVYGNTFTQDARGTANNGYLIKFAGNGYNAGLKIHDNTITKQPYDVDSWDFAIELWSQRGGIEIYNNTIRGAIDLGGYHTTDSLGYGFAAKIYNNTIYTDTVRVYPYIENGIYVERQTSGGLYIYNNTFRNLAIPITLQTFEVGDGDDMEDIYIYYNLMDNVGCKDGGTAYGVAILPVSALNQAAIDCEMRNLNIYNNTIYQGDGNATVGIKTGFYDASDRANTLIGCRIKNNIIHGFSYAMYADGGTIDTIDVQNNILYGNGNSNNPYWTGATVTNKTETGTIKLDPVWISATDFRLTAGSPAVNAGLDVGLSSDIKGYWVNDTPDIGAYEYKILKLRSSKFLKSGGKFLITR